VGHGTAPSAGNLFETLNYSLHSGLLTRIVAKELCSCHFIEGLSLSDCKRLSNLPPGTELLADIHVDDSGFEVTAHPSGLAQILNLGRSLPAARAGLNRSSAKLGCQILQTL